jgi:hypothetical protein
LRRPLEQVSRNHQLQKNHLTTFSICGTNADGLQCLYVVIADGKDDDPSKDSEAQDEGDVTLLFSRIVKTYFLTTNSCLAGLDPPIIRQISDMTKGNGQCSVSFSSVIITMAVTTLWRHGFHFRKGVFRASSFFLAGVQPSVMPADSDIEMADGEYSLNSHYKCAYRAASPFDLSMRLFHPSLPVGPSQPAELIQATEGECLLKNQLAGLTGCM